MTTPTCVLATEERPLASLFWDLTALSFEALCRALHAIEADGQVTATITRHGVCHVHLTITHGSVTLCSLEENETLMIGDLQWVILGKSLRSRLQESGVVDWQWSPVQIPSRVTEILVTSIPCVIQQVPRHTIDSWSHLVRNVFFLVNGKRTIAEIARLLNMHSPAGVAVIIADLCDKHILATSTDDCLRSIPSVRR